MPAEPNNSKEASHPITDFLKKYKTLLALIALLVGGAFTFGLNFGRSNCNNEQYQLRKDNDNLKTDTANLNSIILQLRKDSAEHIATINTLRGMDVKKHGDANPKQGTQVSDISDSQNTPEIVQTPTTTILEDSKVIEIRKLKAENKELRKNLELIRGDKVELKRRVQKYLGEQDLLILELETLQEKITLTHGKEREEAEKEFANLIKKAKAERIKFDETDDGKEIQKEVEEDKRKQAEMERAFSQQEQQIRDLREGLANLKSENASDYFDNANSTLNSAENMFNWFGINNKEKCNLIKQVADSYDNATRLGKDCSTHKAALKKKYPKCF